MNIKSNYFKMGKEEFDAYLTNIKASNNVIYLLNDKFFFDQSNGITNLIINSNKKMFELDNLVNSFSSFARNQIIQSFLVNEIEATNKIEKINSTKHNILSIIDNISTSKDKKIISIANAYKLSLESKGNKI